MIGSATEVAENIFCRVKVAAGRVLTVLGEEARDDRKVRTSGVGEPRQGAHDGLETGTESRVGGSIGRDVINMETGAMGGGSWITGGHIKVGEERLDKSFLREVDGDVAGRGIYKPFVVGAKKPFNGAHKIHANEGSKGGFKVMFDVVRGGEINKIIDVDSHVERGLARKRGAEEEAGSMRTGEKTELGKEGLDHVVPVTRGTT